MAFVLSLVVGAAESAVPNATNKKSYACMNKKTRIIKMLDYPKVKTCPKRHKRISWNAKGNPGAPGPAGPADWNAIGNKPHRCDVPKPKLEGRADPSSHDSTQEEARPSRDGPPPLGDVERLLSRRLRERSDREAGGR